MNYYPFHLGDYAARTAHLEPMEDLAYRRLLDLYYLGEIASLLTVWSAGHDGMRQLRDLLAATPPQARFKVIVAALRSYEG